MEKRQMATAGRKNTSPSVRGRQVDAGQHDPGMDNDSVVVSAGAESSSAVTPIPASHTQVAAVVNHPALIVTRNIEWGTVVLGFEQSNKYTVLDQDGNVVALLAEDLGGLRKEFGRQFLRTRRSFTATILSPNGEVILKLRRPMYLINSTIYIENGQGETIGEVRQNWHLWQRNYSVYLGKRQIAAINSPLLAWEFALIDEGGGVLALIDRNFQGFGKELFTDAGKYVIHFGDKPQDAAEQVANTVQAAHPDKPRPDVTKLAQLRTDIAVIPTSSGNQLEVTRPMSVDERALVLATAVSIDFDYFSQHSHGSGMLPFMMPMPMPSYPPDPEGGSVDGTATPASPQPSPEDMEKEAAGAEADILDSGEGDFSQNTTMEDLKNAYGENGTQGAGELGDIDAEWEDDSAGWSQGGGDGEGDGGGGIWDIARDFFDND